MQGMIGLVCLSGLLLELTACASTGPALSSDVGAIRTGLAAIETGTEESFVNINAAVREDTITLLLKQKKGPDEASFAPRMTSETRAQWMTAFEALDTYLAALEQLVKSDRSEATSSNVAEIAKTLQSPVIGAKLPQETVGLFSGLAGSLVQAATEQNAQNVMRRTDKHFSALLNCMADLVGNPPENEAGTLRAMVAHHWANRLDVIQQSFRAVALDQEEVRRPVLESYGAAIDAQEEELFRLAKLRESMLAIAEAHSAAAEGGPAATLFWIGRIHKLMQDAREQANEEGE